MTANIRVIAIECTDERWGACRSIAFWGLSKTMTRWGNRALGDRIADAAGMERAKIAAALVLMSPFIPMLFQGEEWAASSPFLYFADHEDEEIARLVSEGRKREFAAFGWDPASIPDPEKRETFEKSKLKWDEVSQPEHSEMRAWYCALIRLRRSTSCLNDGEPGRTHVSWDQDQMWLSMDRGNVRVVCNLASAERAFPLAEEVQVVLGSQAGVSIKNGILNLPPDSVAIVRIEGSPDGI